MYTSSGDNSLYVSSVPAFLSKLWTLVEDPATDELICWDAVSISSNLPLPLNNCATDKYN